MTAHVIMTFHILAAVLLEVEKPFFDVLPTNFRFFLANKVPYKAPKLSFLSVADSVASGNEAQKHHSAVSIKHSFIDNI